MTQIKSIWLLTSFSVVFIVNADIQSLSNIKPINKLNLFKPNPSVCNLNPNLISEIANYSTVANLIFQTVLNGSFKGRTYNDLAYFVDTFGHRLAGTDSLEKSLDFLIEKMIQDGIENVHSENVTVPHWIRGHESATLISPRRKNLAILGLGLTVGTTHLGIFTKVLVVKTFDELKENAKKARGKIVVFNDDFINFNESTEYRNKGASAASKYGAVACLVRSVTDLSIGTPHAGVVHYDAGVKKIPTAAITVEDAQLLNRLQDREISLSATQRLAIMPQTFEETQLVGEQIYIHLKLIDSNVSPATSRNIIGEIKGREKPDEVVIISGHTDSWDVGQGAMDDGGGIFVSKEALAVLKFLNLRPRRTLRAVFWTSDELELDGVRDYVKRHKNELKKISVILESDLGTFKPLGLDFAGVDEAGCIIQEVLKLMPPLNASTYRPAKSYGGDMDFFIQEGVPSVSLNTEMERYFWYHHTEADTMSVENTEELDLCTALWTVASYVLADLSVSLHGS